MPRKQLTRLVTNRSRKGVGGRPRGAPTAVVRLPLPVAALARRLAQGTLRAGDINGFLDVQTGRRIAVPFAGVAVECGFPSPAEDYLDGPLDFNELLVGNPAATFAVRLAGESMIGAGLFPGDIAVVDRSVAPTNNCIVLALLDGEFTVKRYRRSNGCHHAAARERQLRAGRLSPGTPLRNLGRRHPLDPHAVA